MATIKGANSAAAGYEIEASCDFNQADSDHMTNTPASNGNQRIWTFSAWVKVDSDNDARTIFHIGTWPAEPWTLIAVHDTDKILFRSYYSGADYLYLSNTTFDEDGTWNHLVIAVDTTQGTDTNRVKMYKNGTQLTSFQIHDKVAQNYDTGANQSNLEHQLGEEGGLGRYFNGVMSEVYMIDGEQLAPTAFAENDGGTWTAIEYTGDFGTAGFYLDFKDASDLGNDVSGNGEHFAEVNIVSGNQITSGLPPFK
tara:strand:- start:171 stop:929 length:759 start_codon:yes stop_codon:yes gene_type:complete